MKVKIWLIGWSIIVSVALGLLGLWVYKVDPYFHYHLPDTERYYYPLDYQRGQNDGILRNFDYDTIVCGSSMIENIRTTEVDEVFGCNSVKVPFNGASYKEINDNLKNALRYNPNVKTVIRALDTGRFLDPWDAMPYDPVEYPTFLYDNNPFNDVAYLLNREVLFGRVYSMSEESRADGFEGGMTSFDDYSKWPPSVHCGINTVCPDGITVSEPKEELHLTDENRAAIEKNIKMNVTELADAYPDVQFYYYYSPYSILSWNIWNNAGSIYRMFEAEEYISELIVTHENIHLFSFNSRTDIITDFNNYRDEGHYGRWVNSLILKWMHEDMYRLTAADYKERVEKELDFYTSFDYAGLNGQEDYEDDLYAAALLNKELTGVEPLEISDKRFEVNLDEGYNYLVFDCKKITDNGRFTAWVYGEDGSVVGRIEKDYTDLDNDIHKYVIDLSTVSGKVTVELNDDSADTTDSSESGCQFSNVFIY